MVTRRRPLSITHEDKVVNQSVELFAPPAVISLMVILSENILKKNKAQFIRLLDLVFQLSYPLSVIHRVLEKGFTIVDPCYLLEETRKRLVDHYNKGCIASSREDDRKGMPFCFAKQVSDAYSRGTQHKAKLPAACGEWFDKLRYLIGKSSNEPCNTRNKTLLHTALTNPQSPISLIEYLCRLNPVARYEDNDGALPIHLACIHWYPEAYRAEDEVSCTKVLNLLLAGDFGLVRRKYHGRIALHHAILNGKPLPCIKTILNLDRDTVLIPDPTEKLFAFQLAAISMENRDGEPSEGSSQSSSSKNTRQLEMIFKLLTTNPLVLSLCGMQNNVHIDRNE